MASSILLGKIIRLRQVIIYFVAAAAAGDAVRVRWTRRRIAT